MSVDWSAFVVVVVTAVVAASAVVTLFSIGLRMSDGAAPWRRPVAVGAFTLCAVIALAGIWLIVPALHPAL